MPIPRTVLRFATCALLSTATWAGAGRPYLSLAQKADVLWTGTVADAEGNRYNVRILPGYRTALGFGTESWGDGWGNQMGGVVSIGRGLMDAPRSLKRLGEYGTAEPWEGIADGWVQGKDVVVWSVSEMMTTGAAEDWSEYWSDADEARARESFGWTLAYPWAIAKGIVNTAIRQGIGVVCIGAGVAWALVLRPAYQLSKPVVLTAFDLGVATGRIGWGGLRMGWGLAVNQLFLGTATPIAGWAWNTALGLPMAIAGKVPTPVSADGWWVSQISGNPVSVSAIDGPDVRYAWDGVTDSVPTAYWMEDAVARVRREGARDSVLASYTPVLEGIQSRMDSLSELRDSLRARQWRDAEQAESVFPRRFLVPDDYRKCRGEVPAALPPELDARLRAWIARDSLGAGLSDSAVDGIVDRYRRTWGRCRDQGKVVPANLDPGAKFNPNLLIREEVQQILD